MNNYVSAHTDMWIIETDSSGNFLWDKRIGTLNDDYAVDAIKTSDGKYLLSETNSANAGGDKTVNTNGVDDFWIVKTDSMMNIIWDISIGCTSNEDDKGKLFQTYDGNYFISGTSYSDSCYWKKEINNGPENTFIVKIDTAGNKIWDKTILTGYAHNEAGLVAELSDHCIVVVNDGDGFLGGYKTDQSYNFDFWCLKLCDSTSSSIASSFNAPSDVCQEECVSFTNTSSGATSYLWLFPGAAIASSTSANPSGICYNNPGTYDVTLIAFNGGNSDTMTITNAITVHAYPQPFIYTIGDTLFTQTGYAHYQWYSVNTPVGTDSPVLPVNIGTAYIVTVTDIYGCTGTSMPIDFQVGINDDNKSNWADVNYNSEEKIISCVINDAFADEKIEIIDASGKCVYKNKFHQNKTIINASNFSKGIYFVKIQSQNRQTIRKIAIN
jgi:PKD repeat protein